MLVCANYYVATAPIAHVRPASGFGRTGVGVTGLSAGFGHVVPDRPNVATFRAPQRTTSFVQASARSQAQFAQTMAGLKSLLDLRDGWNGPGTQAPGPEAVGAAFAWLSELYAENSSRGGEWHTPNVTASADGDVVLEWWRGRKKLTVYVSPSSGAEYVKSWGSDIGSEMEDGPADTADARVAILGWLLS